MSEVDIAKLVALAKAATPGPWAYFEHQPGRRYEAIGVRAGDVEISRAPSFAEAENRVVADHHYVAALSPDVLIALLSEVKAGRVLADAVSAGADDRTPPDVLSALREYTAVRGEP